MRIPQIRITLSVWKESGSNGRKVGGKETGQGAVSVQFVRSNHESGSKWKWRPMHVKVILRKRMGRSSHRLDKAEESK